MFNAIFADNTVLKFQLRFVHFCCTKSSEKGDFYGTSGKIQYTS